MVPLSAMNDNPNTRAVRGVRATDEAWAQLTRLADAVGCHNKDGQPSVTRMLEDLAHGSLTLVRTRPTEPRSRSERIRLAIEADPAASNAEIASQTGEVPAYVGLIRKRMGAPTQGT